MASNSNSKKSEDTQKTRPKKGEPIEIPVPSKGQIMRDFEKIATAKSDEESDEATPADRQ